jgi:hypothetical protein
METASRSVHRWFRTQPYRHHVLLLQTEIAGVVGMEARRLYNITATIALHGIRVKYRFTDKDTANTTSRKRREQRLHLGGDPTIAQPPGGAPLSRPAMTTVARGRPPCQLERVLIRQEHADPRHGNTCTKRVTLCIPWCG